MDLKVVNSFLSRLVLSLFIHLQSYSQSFYTCYYYYYYIAFNIISLGIYSGSEVLPKQPQQYIYSEQGIPIQVPSAYSTIPMTDPTIISIPGHSVQEVPEDGSMYIQQSQIKPMAPSSHSFLPVPTMSSDPVSAMVQVNPLHPMNMVNGINRVGPANSLVSSSSSSSAPPPPPPPPPGMTAGGMMSTYDKSMEMEESGHLLVCQNAGCKQVYRSKQVRREGGE